jgi:NAD(P)-dependent dehydrogenase (short-subunit alcohol dehydrogenase family)
MKSKPTVLVTGASTGIGYACAVDLDDHGFTVFAGVRKQSDAEALRRSRPRIEPIIMDVTDYASVDRAATELSHGLGEQGLDGLVNNAGISVSGPLECLPMADFDRQLRVNVSGQVAVTQAFLPLLRRTRGRVVFMSSESGRVVLPLLGAYAASKHALEAVADAFRRELAHSGVRVSIVEPGSVKTPIWEKAVTGSEALRTTVPNADKLYGKQLASIGIMATQAARFAADPEVVTRAVHHALSARVPKLRYLVGPEAKALVLLHAVSPTRVFDWGLSQSLRLLAKLPAL